MPAAMHCGASMRPSTSRISSAAAHAFARSSTQASSPRAPAAGTRAARRSSSSGYHAPVRRLVEQILASHSRVEGTMELPNILNIVGQFDDMAPARDGYPETVARVPAAQLTALGRALSWRRRHRCGTGGSASPTSCPITSATSASSTPSCRTRRIIDARRHPMDACFSTFKQYFAEGQTFSYDLEDLGRYYRCYLSLMDHWDAVLPGKVLHVQYEELVRDPEGEYPPPARALPAAVRTRVPQLPRDAALGAHRQRRAGAPADLHLRRRLLAALREGARAAASGARRQPRAIQAPGLLSTGPSIDDP